MTITTETIFHQKTQNGHEWLSDQQSKILAFYQAKLGLIKKVSFQQFQFNGPLSETYTVAISTVKINSEVYYIIASLPTTSKQAFIMLTDTVRRELAELTAYCCSQTETHHKLPLGYTAELPALSDLRKQNWHGYMITRLNDVLDNSIDKQTTHNEHFEIYCIMLLKHTEYDAARHNTALELLTFFKTNKRPLFKFKSYADATAAPFPEKFLIAPTQPTNYIDNKHTVFSRKGLAEIVAHRQKLKHTDPDNIRKVKHNLQKQLQFSQNQQPQPLHFVNTSALHKTTKAEHLLENFRQRKQRQKNRQSITLIFAAIILLISTSLLIWASTTPVLKLFTGLLLTLFTQ